MLFIFCNFSVFPLSLVVFFTLYCIVYCIVFKYLYSAPQQRWANRDAFGSISSKQKRQVLGSDKDVERLDDKREARAEGGRRFQREGPITEKDLDMAMVVLVRGTKSSRLSREGTGRKDEAEVGSRMASRRYLGAPSIWALRTISKTLYSIRV